MALTWAGVVLNGSPVRMCSDSSRLCKCGRRGWEGWGGGYPIPPVCRCLTQAAAVPATHMRLMSRDSVLDAVRGIGSSISISAGAAGSRAANRVQLLVLQRNHPWPCHSLLLMC
jgi:hypothetical protein